MSKKYLNNNLLNKFKKRKYLKSNVLLNSISGFIDDDDNESKMIKTSMLNDIKSKVNNYNFIRDTIIKTQTIKKDIDVESLYNNKENNFTKELEKAWVGRTNAPYKNIIKDDKRREFEKKEDLIVHTVTEKDKIGVNDEFVKFEKSINNHNKELKNIYSMNKELEHKEKFEYNHKYKFRIKHNPRNHMMMKDNVKEEYNKDEIEKNKRRVELDNLMSNLIKNGVLDKEDIEVSSLK